jgi:hypothetical protein
MLTIDTPVHVSENVLFTGIEKEAVLLNTRTNKYFGLNEVAARFWDLIENNSIREAYNIICSEFEINPRRLEQDLLEFVDLLVQHGLLELN